MARVVVSAPRPDGLATVTVGVMPFPAKVTVLGPTAVTETLALAAIVIGCAVSVVAIAKDQVPGTRVKLALPAVSATAVPAVAPQVGVTFAVL